VSSANSLPKPVILSATSFIKIRKSNGPKTDPWITFADISKVFDTVWVKALILKLENYGIKGKLLFWLKSYLSRPKQRVIQTAIYIKVCLYADDYKSVYKLFFLKSY
jgi:hypothetical protein